MRVESLAVRRGFAIGLLLALLAYATPGLAHDSLTAQIARITAELSRDPDNARLLLRRGELRRMNRQWREALADLDRAAALDPTSRRIDLVRAHVFFDASRWADAVAAATTFLTQQPDDADARLVRARALVKLRRVDDAAADFTRSLERQPIPDVYVERVRLQREAGRLEAALQGVEDGLKRLGPVVTLELEALDLETRLRRFDGALARLDRLAAHTARPETWLARRGEVLWRAGRITDARAAYQAALAAADRLPPWTRQTRATQQLVARVRVELERVSRPVTHTRNQP